MILPKTMEDFSFGPYTDPVVRQALENPRQPIPPLAVHFEDGNSSRSLTNDEVDSAWKYHSLLCSEILGKRENKSAGWQTGLLDYSPFYKRDSQDFWSRLDAHPSIKIVTVSTSVHSLHTFDSDINRHSGFRDLLIFKAAGNSGFSLQELRRNEALSPMIFAPGYFRIGECDRDGRAHEKSAACGPVFLCTHPFHDPDFSMPLPDGSTIDAVFGTSASAPAAANMIMRHTMGLKGLGISETMSAAILAAAQKQTAQIDGSDVVENNAGLVFDRYQSGFGALTDAPLAEQIARLRTIVKKARNQNPDRSNLLLHEGTPCVRAKHKFRLLFNAHSHGIVANVAILADFALGPDESAVSFDERKIPPRITIGSTSGSEIDIPLLVRKPSVEPSSGIVQAGFSTSAFFGEKFDPRDWIVSTPYTWETGLYPLVNARLLVHCMHEESPGAALIRQYQRASRGAAPDSGFLKSSPGTANAAAPAPQDLNLP